MTIAERLKKKYYSDDGGGHDVVCDFEAAINEALEEAAKEVEVCLQIYAKSGGGKSQRLTKVGVCMGVAMRIRALK